MLKVVCKQCINRHCENDPWDKNDEQRWQRGILQCAKRSGYDQIKVLEHPPADCGYKLEHLVLGQNSALDQEEEVLSHEC